MKYIKEYIDFEEDWEEFEEDNDHQIIKDINKQFYDFLVEEGVIDQYIENIRNENIRKYGNVGNVYWYIFLKEKNPSLYIDRAFTWTSTKQGHIFWKNIEVDWDNYLYNKNLYDKRK